MCAVLSPSEHIVALLFDDPLTVVLLKSYEHLYHRLLLPPSIFCIFPGVALGRELR